MAVLDWVNYHLQVAIYPAPLLAPIADLASWIERSEKRSGTDDISPSLVHGEPWKTGFMLNKLILNIYAGMNPHKSSPYCL